MNMRYDYERYATPGVAPNVLFSACVMAAATVIGIIVLAMEVAW